MLPVGIFGREHWFYLGAERSNVKNLLLNSAGFPSNVSSWQNVMLWGGTSWKTLFAKVFPLLFWKIVVCRVISGSYRERYFYRRNKLFPRDSV